jgi:metal-responsive CopG/Arc/MetJ family transcriptional regulator
LAPCCNEVPTRIGNPREIKRCQTEKDLLETVGQLSGENKNRSEFIEVAIQAYVAQHTRDQGNATDLEVIYESADILNQEALDVLEYQVAP